MTIAVGDTIPSGSFGYIPYTPEIAAGTSCGVPGKLNTDEWKGKKVVVFGVPGAFTPGCSLQHLPGFIKLADDFSAKGIDTIAVVATNDFFVQAAWVAHSGAEGKVIGISDVNGEWLKAAGLSQDIPALGGVRSQRFALIIDDLKVTYAGIETEKGITVSSAESVLAKL